jgi:response regulator RpfG family c-di-GMP phosphodiesterase
MLAEKKRILYVDDESINLQLFKINFQDLYEVITASSAKIGLDILSNEPIKVVISDLKMPEMNGIDFIEKIKSETPEKVCILLTAYIEPDVMLKAINQELIFRYVTKPWQKKDLYQIIEQAFEKCFNAH